MEESTDLLDNTSGQENVTYTHTPPARPVFLTVLCILTFVASGFGLIAAIFGLLFSEMNETSMRIASRSMQNNPFGDVFQINFEEVQRWTVYSNWANLLGSALCLTGALLMWKLKKIGYFLYIPGWIIPTVVSAFAMKYMLSGWMSGFGSLGIVISAIFAIGFIVMYGLNYKHLK